MLSVAEIGGSEMTSVAQRLGAVIEPSLRTNFLDALNQLVQEFNVTDTPALTIQLEGDDVHLTRLVSAGSDTSTSPTSDYSARIALRLSDELKESIEGLAGDVGSSVNSWIVRTLERSVRTDQTSRVTKGTRQLRGKGRACCARESRGTTRHATPEVHVARR